MVHPHTRRAYRCGDVGLLSSTDLREKRREKGQEKTTAERR